MNWCMTWKPEWRYITDHGRETSIQPFTAYTLLFVKKRIMTRKPEWSASWRIHGRETRMVPFFTGKPRTFMKFDYDMET